MTDRAKLRALAGEATRGPWSAERFFVDSEHGPVVDEATTLANADYIAAADPTTVLELLDAVDRLTAKLAAAVCSTCNGSGRRERRGYTGRLVRGDELCPDCDNGNTCTEAT